MDSRARRRDPTQIFARSLGMPLRHVTINNAEIPVSRYSGNSLTEDAQAKFHLDAVHLDVLHTRFSSLKLPILTGEAFGFIFYVAQRLELPGPVSAPVCVRLSETKAARTLPEPLIHRDGSYDAPRGLQLPALAGTMGCTTTLNLGFLLLNQLLSVTTNTLSALIVLDREKLRERDALDLPVADDDLAKFCTDRGFNRISVHSDCDYYDECRNQSGEKCDWERARCQARKS